MQGALHVSRRQSLQGLIVLGAGAAIGGIARPSPVLAQDISDEDIFRFALNLEYMEAEYYLRGTTGMGIDAADAGSKPGDVVGGKQVSFETPAIGEFLQEVAENELAHVRFYRKTLGSNAVDRPAIDFDAGFKAVAEAAGLGADFDPFANEMNFVLGGMLFEDVGVTAYAGAATLLKNKEFLTPPQASWRSRPTTWAWRDLRYTRRERKPGRPPTPSPMPETRSTDRRIRTRGCRGTEKPTSSLRHPMRSRSPERRRRCSGSSI